MGTIDELFATVLAGDPDDEDSDARNAIRQLWRLGTTEVYERAKELLRSAEPQERACALDVMSLLGMGQVECERTFLAERVCFAIEYLNDPNAQVVTSAAWALVHLRRDDCMAALKRLKDHPVAAVRLAVATRLAEVPDQESIEILTELSADENEEVRNWATFGIGTSEFDTPELRRVLRERLDDPFRDARQEAVWGLARRRDTVGLRLLLENLEREEWWTGDESAARDVLGLPRQATIEEMRSGLRLLLVRGSGGDC